MKKMIKKLSLAFSSFSADSLDSLKRRLPGVERELTDQSKFRDLYQFTFNFAKNPEQKGLGIVFNFDIFMKFYHVICSIII